MCRQLIFKSVKWQGIARAEIINLWKFWFNNQVLLPRKLRRCISAWNPMKNYCQTVYYCANTFFFCSSNRFIIYIIKINVHNVSVADFELDLHCHLIDSRLWLNETLWLMTWYMTPQSNRWNVNKQTLKKSNVYNHLRLLCNWVLCRY